MMDNSCFVCGVEANWTCEACHEAYCSAKCQRVDWPEHRTKCRVPPHISGSGAEQSLIVVHVSGHVKSPIAGKNDLINMQTNETTVFSIRGIPGSGKTYICQRLGIVCYDTDDIRSEVWQTLLDDPASAYKQLVRRNAEEAETMFKKTLDQYVRVLIQKAQDRGEDIAFAGITIDDIPADEAFFIEMPPEDFKVAYRRVILREIQKVLDHDEAVKRIVKQQDIDFVSEDLASRFHIEAINITTSFEEYQDMYKRALDYELGLKTRVLTQDKIIDQIRGIRGSGNQSLEIFSPGESGPYYDVAKLIRLTKNQKASETVAVTRKMLSEPVWDDENGTFLAPITVVQAIMAARKGAGGPAAALSSHIARIMSADLSYPLLVWDSGARGRVIVNGYHRLARAFLDGIAELPAVLLSDATMRAAIAPPPPE